MNTDELRWDTDKLKEENALRLRSASVAHRTRWLSGVETTTNAGSERVTQTAVPLTQMNTDELRWDTDKLKMEAKSSYPHPKVASIARTTKLHLRVAVMLVVATRKPLQARPPEREFCFSKTCGKRTSQLKLQKSTPGVSVVASTARATNLHPQNAAFLAAAFCEPLQVRPPEREFCFSKTRGRRTS